MSFNFPTGKSNAIFCCCCCCHFQLFKYNSQHRLLCCQISSKPLSDPLSLRCNHSRQSFAHMHKVTLKTLCFLSGIIYPLEAVNCNTLPIHLSIIYLTTLFCNLLSSLLWVHRILYTAFGSRYWLLRVLDVPYPLFVIDCKNYSL